MKYHTKKELTMRQKQIKNLVRKYNLISTLWLSVFLLILIGANWWFTDANIERHAELGLEYTTSQQGFIWGAIIVGLNIVLQLFFYSLERILVQQESQ